MAGNNYGNFVPTTAQWDTSKIASSNLPPELKSLFFELYQNLNLMSLSLNGRDAGIYNTNEFVNGQRFFPNPANNSSTPGNAVQRQVYRLVVNFGALPNNTTKTVAHGLTINNAFTFTRIYGCASDTTNKLYVPLPYVSTTGDPIELSVDDTNVVVTTISDWSAYTITYIILEYLKF